MARTYNLLARRRTIGDGDFRGHTSIKSTSHLRVGLRLEIETMTLAPFLASQWRLFLAIAGASFVAFALAVIFLLPGPRVLIRSTIDVGSYFHLGDPSPIYAPDTLVRRTLDVYVPSTLSSMSKEGI